jgi:hypothetical protein
MLGFRSGEVADCGFLMLEYQKSSAAASHIAFGYSKVPHMTRHLGFDYLVWLVSWGL